MASQLPSVNDSHTPDIRANQHWPAVRDGGKIDRRNLTDAIKAFIDYVDHEGEGSSRPDLAYSNFTRTIYAGFGLNKQQREAIEAGDTRGRDLFDLTELRYLQMAESIAAAIIWEGMDARATRKSIKAKVKEECGRIASSFKRHSKGYFGGGEQ